MIHSRQTATHPLPDYSLTSHISFWASNPTSLKLGYYIIKFLEVDHDCAARSGTTVLSHFLLVASLPAHCSTHALMFELQALVPSPPLPTIWADTRNVMVPNQLSAVYLGWKHHFISCNSLVACQSITTPLSSTR